MPANSLNALFFLLHVGALLLTAHAMAAANDSLSGRMVIVRAATRTAPVTDARASSVTIPSMAWRRRLEDEVAPEFPVGGLLGAGIGYGPLNGQQPQCVHNCAAKGPGSSYTRPCTYKEQCSQGHD